MTCSAPGNGWPPQPAWTSGPAPTPCRRRRRSPASAGSSAGSRHPGRPHTPRASRDRPSCNRRAAPPRDQPRHAPHPPAAPRHTPGAHRMTSASPSAAAMADDGRRSRLRPPTAKGHRRDQPRRHRRHRDQRLRHRPRRGRSTAHSFTGTATCSAKSMPPRPSPPAESGPAVTRASLQADLLAAHERAIRLTARIQQLERRLSETLGEQTWREVRARRARRHRHPQPQDHQSGAASS